MKRLVTLCIITFSLIFANPVMVSPGFSEIQVLQPDNWKIEVFNILNNVDSIYLETDNGIARVNQLDTLEEVAIFDQDDLSHVITINLSNDLLKLYMYMENSWVDSVLIGDRSGSYLHNITSSQSICGEQFSYDFYKVNTQTFGILDTSDHRAVIHGYCYDTNHDPVRDINLRIYQGMVDHSEYIDSTGYYTAKLKPKSYSYSSFLLWRPYEEMLLWEIQPIQFDLEPEDSMEVNFVSLYTSVKPVIKNNIVKLNNYPHPASSYTWLFIDNTDVEASAMRVNVYALNGRKVDSFIPAAKQFRYDCAHLPQGSYVLSLQQGNEVLASKKLQIIK